MYLAERLKDGLDPDGADEQREQRDAEDEGEDVEVEEPAAALAPAVLAGVGGDVNLGVEQTLAVYVQLAVRGGHALLSARCAQGFASGALLVSATGVAAGAPSKISLTTRPGKVRKPRCQRTGTGRVPSAVCPVSASSVGMKLKLS